MTGVLFLGKLGFPFLVNLFFFYSYSMRLETGLFERRRADYVHLISFNWIVLLVLSFALDLPIIGIPLIISLLYVWCISNADQIVSFWFGTRFPVRP